MNYDEVVHSVQKASANVDVNAPPHIHSAWVSLDAITADIGASAADILKLTKAVAGGDGRAQLRLSDDGTQVRLLSVQERIALQLDFYFCDSNWCQDLYLQLQSEKYNGVVPVRIVVGFKLMRSLLSEAGIDDIREDAAQSHLQQAILTLMDATEHCMNVLAVTGSDGEPALRKRTLVERVVRAFNVTIEAVAHNERLIDALSARNDNCLPIAEVMHAPLVRSVCRSTPQCFSDALRDAHSALFDVDHSNLLLRLKSVPQWLHEAETSAIAEKSSDSKKRTSATQAPAPTPPRAPLSSSADEMVRIGKWRPHLNEAGNRDSFTVLSWNILAQYLTNMHQYCEKEYRSWSFRRDLILDYVRKADADILCLQEVQGVETFLTTFEAHNVKKRQRNHARELLLLFDELGYAGAYARRDGTRHTDLGNMVCWRRDRFSVRQEALVVRFAPSLATLCKDEASREHFAATFLAQVAVVVRLTDKRTNAPLVACSTHICCEWIENERQVAQLSVLCEELDCNDAVVIGVDMNAQPNTPPYKFMKHAKLIYSTAQIDEDGDVVMDREEKDGEIRKDGSVHWALPPHVTLPAWRRHDGGVVHSLQLDSAYAALHGAEPQYTSVKPAHADEHGGFRGTLDYIWFNVNRLTVVAVSSLPSGNELLQVGLPCSWCPSDHLPLLSRFVQK